MDSALEQEAREFSERINMVLSDRFFFEPISSLPPFGNTLRVMLVRSLDNLPPSTYHLEYSVTLEPFQEGHTLGLAAKLYEGEEKLDEVGREVFAMKLAKLYVPPGGYPAEYLEDGLLAPLIAELVSTFEELDMHTLM